jgi:hypothetical protein
MQAPSQLFVKLLHSFAFLEGELHIVKLLGATSNLQYELSVATKTKKNKK